MHLMISMPGHLPRPECQPWRNLLVSLRVMADVRMVWLCYNSKPENPYHGTWRSTQHSLTHRAYISVTSSSGGAAAEMAATRKMAKYADLPASYLFQQVTLETLGPIIDSAVDFLSELGSRIGITAVRWCYGTSWVQYFLLTLWQLIACVCIA